MKRSLLHILAVIISSMAFYACGEKKGPATNPANAPVPVNLQEVHLERVTYHDRYPATANAQKQVDLRPVESGYVTGIFFNEGDHVKKGQKLYTIDDSKYQASYNEAKANVTVAEANAEQAKKDADRYIYLNEHEAVAKQIMDHAMTTLANAKSQVTAAKQALARAKTDIEYATITAPFEGVIGISQVRVGTAVVAGQTVLNTISTDGPIFVDFVVNEKQIPRFMQLKRKKLRPADSVFTFQMPDGSVYGRVGEMTLIDRGVNTQTGTIIVRLTFPNPDNELRSGMSGVVRVRNDDTARSLVVPAKAIVEQMGEYFVYIAKDTLIPTEKKEKDARPDASAWHAIQKRIVMGQTIGDKVVIRSGIDDGDKLIVDGVQKLHDGSLIAVGK